MRNARKGDSFMERNYHYGFTDKEVTSFFERIPEFNQKVNTIASDYFDSNIFKECLRQLQNLATEKILENSSEFDSNYLKETILLDAKASLVCEIIEKLFFNKVIAEINQDTILAFISDEFILTKLVETTTAWTKSIKDFITLLNDEQLFQYTLLN